MSTYFINWSTWANTVTEVEADSLDDAIERSYDLLPGSLCHQCASKVDVGDEWTETSAYCDDEEIELRGGAS